MLTTSRLAHKALAICLFSFALTSCGTLLPESNSVMDSPWASYQDAQKTFDSIIVHKTTLADLKKLKLDPEANPNITILNYSDVIRRFIPSPSVNARDLDAGVEECIAAKSACKGYEVDQKSIKRQRYGNFWADFLNFKRKVDVVGWRFNGIILIKNDVVIYKLTGGQPAIHELEENMQPLGPFQGIDSVR
ncbi:MAG: hypothetical protein K8F27_06110 [Sulfuricellaceae bacterium]|nr:hypothetical protein [Sulfuricellaceae bacterium]